MRPVGFYRCLEHLHDVLLMFLLEYVHIGELEYLLFNIMGCGGSLLNIV
jgi:hypothetical protein